MRMKAAAVAGSLVVGMSGVTLHGQQEIVARDGDRIVIEDDARIQIVRRRQASVRTVLLEPQRELIVLLDFGRPGELPDGRPDVATRYSDIRGEWPLGQRWEGFTTVLEYADAAFFPRALALMTPQGLLQLIPENPSDGPWHDSAASKVVTFNGLAGGKSLALTFDEAERQKLAEAAQSDSTPGMGMRVVGSIGGVSGPGSTRWSAPAAPERTPEGTFRVGGSIRPPRKIRDAAPVYPDAAREAKVVGIVLLEITIAPDGSVTNPRVLRGIPLLDAAAIAAVHEWNYEPTLVDGKAVPVLMTVVVPFAP